MTLEPASLPQDRTLNVNQAELYNFFTNDTNAFNNFIGIGGQVRRILRLTSLATTKY